MIVRTDCRRMGVKQCDVERDHHDARHDAVHERERHLRCDHVAHVDLRDVRRKPEARRQGGTDCGRRDQQQRRLNERKRRKGRQRHAGRMTVANQQPQRWQHDERQGGNADEPERHQRPEAARKRRRAVRADLLLVVRFDVHPWQARSDPISVR